WGDDVAMNALSPMGLTRREVTRTDERGEAVFVEAIPEQAAGDVDLRIDAVAGEAGEEVEGSTVIHALASAHHVSLVSADPAARDHALRAHLRVLALPLRPVPHASVRVDLYQLAHRGRVRRAVWLESRDLTTGDD